LTSLNHPFSGLSSRENDLGIGAFYYKSFINLHGLFINVMIKKI
jgi:hypothetical protein